ncbi:RRXRR domain-containing protein [Anoxybacillus flavithermus]
MKQGKAAIYKRFPFTIILKKCPLAPCHEAVARKLLKQGKAAIYRRFPFTIILKKSYSCLRPARS